MDPEPPDEAALIYEILRILPEEPEDLSVAFPAELELREAVRRLEAVPDGAGWDAIHRALNDPSPPNNGLQGTPGCP